MYKINLNCDLGEGAAFDGKIIPLINMQITRMTAAQLNG